MTKITDAEVEAAAKVLRFATLGSVRAALEAAEAVRVKAESNLQKVQIPTSASGGNPRATVINRVSF
jgi:hypothetical protein